MLIKLLFKAKNYISIIFLINIIKKIIIKNSLYFKHYSKTKLKYFITLLKSPHVYKTAQEQIGFKIHKKGLRFVLLKKNHTFFFMKKIQKIMSHNVFLNFKLTYNKKMIFKNLKKLFNLKRFTFRKTFNINYLKLLDVLGEINLKS